MKYNGVVLPRGFTVTVDADSPKEAEELIREYVTANCICTLQRTDNTYVDENLLDEFDVVDTTEW